MNRSSITPVRRDDCNKWVIRYRIPGYSKMFYESFDSEEEANFRAAEATLLRAKGALLPPVSEPPRKNVTLSDYLDEYVRDYGSTHWGDNQYSVVTRQIRDYVKTAPISSLLLKDIRPVDVDRFYNSLLVSPAVLRAGHTEQKTVGISVIEKIHVTLKAAFNQAVRWGYIEKNPAEFISIPKVERHKRSVWSPEDAQMALSSCSNSMLKVCMLIAIGCSMRIGEILGLQWDCVQITEESARKNTSTIEVRQELKRCDKTSLEATKLRETIYFVFPEKKSANPCKTSLVLKSPKTESSKRTIYVPNTVALELLSLRKEQAAYKDKSGPAFHDYNMVIAWPDGSPVEERIIAKALKELIKSAVLPEVVFHSLRHLSASMKLQLSGGDIKAVQGDTGHAQSDMVTGVYGHTFDSNRRLVAERMESSFFSPNQNVELDEKKEQVLNLLLEKPELLDLILAIGKNI